MFLASTRCALIACQYLSQSYSADRYIPAPEIAEYYKINVRVLMPPLRQLTKAGILLSRVGGNEPGFIFSHDPKDISLLRVITVLEGSSEFLCCHDLIQGIKCSYDSPSSCPLFNSFREIIEQGKQKLAHISVAEYGKRDRSPNLL